MRRRAMFAVGLLTRDGHATVVVYDEDGDAWKVRDVLARGPQGGSLYGAVRALGEAREQVAQ